MSPPILHQNYLWTRYTGLSIAWSACSPSQQNPEEIIDDILDTLDDAFSELEIDEEATLKAEAELAKKTALQQGSARPTDSVPSAASAPSLESQRPTDTPNPSVSRATSHPLQGTPSDATLARAPSSAADKVRKLIGDTKAPETKKAKKSKTANALKAFFQEVTDKGSNNAKRRPSTIAGDVRTARRDPAVIVNLWDTLEREILDSDLGAAQVRNRWEENNQKKQEREQMDLEDLEKPVGSSSATEKGVGGLLKRVQSKLVQSTQNLRKSSSQTLSSMKRLYQASFSGSRTPRDAPSPSSSRYVIPRDHVSTLSLADAAANHELLYLNHQGRLLHQVVVAVEVGEMQ